MKLSGNVPMHTMTQRGSGASPIPFSITAKQQHPSGMLTILPIGKNIMKAISKKMRKKGTIEPFPLMHHDMGRGVQVSCMNGMGSSLLLVAHGLSVVRRWKNMSNKGVLSTHVRAHRPFCSLLIPCQGYHYRISGQISLL